VNRRALLRLGALAPAMLALRALPHAALATPAAGGANPSGSAAGGVLEEDESELLLAIVERMVDAGEPDAPRPRDIGTLAAIDSVLGRLDPEIVDPLRTALWLVDWWPTLGELRFRRFRSLSPSEQDESLEGWRTSGLTLRRAVFYALRNLAMLGYWSQSETWALIGYAGPWIRRRT
jgi:hypothetical protein